jgi:hypothetical protein
VDDKLEAEFELLCLLFEIAEAEEALVENEPHLSNR